MGLHTGWASAKPSRFGIVTRGTTPILGNRLNGDKQRFLQCLSRRAVPCRAVPCPPARCARRAHRAHRAHRANRAHHARDQNFTRSPLTSATCRFVDDALPMFEIAAILR